MCYFFYFKEVVKMKRVVLIVAVTLLGLFEFNKTSVAAYYEGVKTEGADV